MASGSAGEPEEDKDGAAEGDHLLVAQSSDGRQASSGEWS